jgi:hypothetical protein
LNNNRSGNNPSGNNRSNSNLSHSGPANTDLADTRRTNTGRGGFGRTNENASKSITLIVRDGDGSQREMQIQDPSPALLQALAREGYAIAR